MWTPTESGHELTIREGRIIARNKAGKELARVPAAAKKGQVWEELDATLTFLHTHDVEAGAEVERWLLRSLPVPPGQLFADAWQRYRDGDVPGYTELRTQPYRRR